MRSAVPEPGPLRSGDLVALLAPTLGQERSREAVLCAARELGIVDEPFAWVEGLGILERLAQGTGILALAARFAHERMAERGGDEPCFTPRLPTIRPPRPPSGFGPRLSLRRLKAQLAPALGQEKSDTLVAEAMRSLGMAGDELSLDQALVVLDRLGTTPGLVGVTARFARARLSKVVSSGDALRSG